MVVVVAGGVEVVVIAALMIVVAAAATAAAAVASTAAAAAAAAVAVAAEYVREQWREHRRQRPRTICHDSPNETVQEKYERCPQYCRYRNAKSLSLRLISNNKQPHL